MSDYSNDITKHGYPKPLTGEIDSRQLVQHDNYPSDAIRASYANGLREGERRERERIADYVKSCRELDEARPFVQVFDVLAKQIRDGKHRAEQEG